MSLNVLELTFDLAIVYMVLVYKEESIFDHQLPNRISNNTLTVRAQEIPDIELNWDEESMELIFSH